MFGRSNVYAMVTGFSVRVKDEREKDRNHLVETTFEVPLTYDLAEEILPAMAHDLFTDNGKDMVPRQELQEATFSLPVDTQLLQIRNHPDLDPEVKLQGVTIRKVKAKKADGGAWLLLFTCGWVLGEPAAAITMIQRLKLGVYLSFQAQEPKLPLDGDQAVDAEVVATDDSPKPEDGVMVPAKRGRGRPKGSKNRKNQADREARAEAAPAVRTCQDCGTEYPDGIQNCPQCGARYYPALPEQAGPDGQPAAAGPVDLGDDPDGDAAACEQDPGYGGGDQAADSGGDGATAAE